jgi:peroxiredoxin (alkyl hydroperoxide reductase subunit C)
MIKPKEARPLGRTLELNETAPNFRVLTTLGIKKLSDYYGRWLLLFSLPRKFTPGQLTEFLSFIDHYASYKAIDCDLLAFSSKDLFSQMNWMYNFKQQQGITVPFPIAADQQHDLSNMFGIHQAGASGSSEAHGIFIIDDEGLLRAMMYNPAMDEQAVPELINLVKHFQTSTDSGVAIGESHWV